MTSDRLDAELRELAEELRWPATPELADHVVARIASPDPDTSMSRLRSRLRPSRLDLGHGPALVAAAILTVLIVGASVPPVRSAVLDALGIAGRERVIRVPGPPDTSRPALDVGARTTLAAAQRRLAFTIRLPRALGPPRDVRYSDAIAGGAVTLIYPRIALLETQGGPDPVLQKQVGATSSVRAVSVAGAPGFYIRGAHEIAVLDRNGRFIPTTRSFVRGNVLVWQRGGVAYRLETPDGLSRALSVARTVP